MGAFSSIFYWGFDSGTKKTDFFFLNNFLSATHNLFTYYFLYGYNSYRRNFCVSMLKRPLKGYFTMKILVKTLKFIKLKGTSINNVTRFYGFSDPPSPSYQKNRTNPYIFKRGRNKSRRKPPPPWVLRNLWTFPNLNFEKKIW
jgi:hypothetical protein